ncbi:MAG: AP2 domain-containing protein [Sedimentisphaerales bacterium]
MKRIINRFDLIFVWPVLLYRLWKYGYTYRRIYLGEGEWTIVETGDYYQLGDLNWYLNGTGWNLYAVRNKKVGPKRTKMVYLHREIMNHPDKLLVDHRNRNSLDNRRSNLRLATHAQNIHNREKRKNTVSRFIGVTLNKRGGKWYARIRSKGKTIYLGSFNNEIEAAKAYDEAAKKYHGEFAILNFPREDYINENCSSIPK